MSWAEFKIRLFALQRKRKYDLELARLTAYHIAIGGLYTFEPKKFPKTIEKFWPIEKKKRNREGLELLKKLQKEYREKKQNG